MGFILFAFAGIAGAIALVVSVILAITGLGIYMRYKKDQPETKKLFFTPAIATILVSYIAVSIWPFPQGNPGSNYTRISIEWAAKAIVYLTAPGIGCFLGGIFVVLFSNRNNTYPNRSFRLRLKRKR